MYLVRMIYVSKPSNSPTKEEVTQILQASQAKNTKNDLTGLMVFNHEYYLQVVEGGRTAVSQLLGRLYQDPRHQDLTMIEFDHIDSRSFGDWSMQFVPAASITKKMVLHNSPTSKFEPEKLTKSGVLELLLALREAARTA
jgi:hypothetical protein